MPVEKDPTYLKVGRLVCTMILLVATAFFMVKSIHWPWMLDETIMRYVNFLIDHGKEPYRDIIDLNLPAAFFVDNWATHVFGPSDLGWRLYEFLLCAILCASTIVIAWPYDWFAGLLGAVLFILQHGSDGPEHATERDQIMAIVVMAAYAVIFLALRKSKPILMLPYGLLIGLAASFKPTAGPLSLALLAMGAFALWKRKQSFLPYVLYALLGEAIAFSYDLWYLVDHHALHAFLDVERRIVPYYAPLGQVSLKYLLFAAFGGAVALLLGLALILALANRDWSNWERWAIALGVCFGAASYFVQHKGWHYQLYPFLVFAFLWMSLEFTNAIRKKGWVRIVGFAAIAIAVFDVVPRDDQRIAHIDSTVEAPDAMQRDLVRLGGPALQNQVECLDMVSGCVTALYRLGLVEPEAVMGDYLFFPPPGNKRSMYYSDMLWNQIHQQPPKVILLTNEGLFGPLEYGEKGFDNLHQWPELETYLNDRYRLDIERTFGRRDFNVSYRIYVLKDSGQTSSLNKPA